MTALCVFSNPCPFCTSCFCLGVHSPNSYPGLQELLEIPHWYSMVFPPRVWARPQDNTFLPQAVEQVMEDGVPGTATDLARSLWAPRTGQQEHSGVCACLSFWNSSDLAFQEQMPTKCPVPSSHPSLSSFLNFYFFLVDKIYAG